MKDDSNAWIDDALDALSAADAGLSPPAHLQAAVLREWDEQQVRQAPRSRWLAWTLLPAAVGVVVAVAVLQRGPVTTSEPGEPPVERAAPLAAGAVSTSEPGAPPAPTAVATPSTRPVAVPRALPAAADAGYIIVPDPLVDPTTLRVVRVRMSRLALATLGLPLVNPDADSLVEVEMLVGDEGVAQSIRRAALVSE
jgi:hypothetical protein